MQNILFVIDTLVCGGAEKSLVSLLPLLNTDKYKISIWIRRRGGEFESLLPPYVEIVKAPTKTFVDTLLYYISLFLFSLKLKLYAVTGKKEHSAETYWKQVGRFLRTPKGKYDIIVAYQQGLPTYLVASKMNARKKIAWVNADIFQMGYNRDYNLSFYRDFDNIVTVSEGLETKLKQAYPMLEPRIKCIYDILNADLITTMSNDRAIEMEGVDKLKLVTVARLVSAKGYNLAVEAGKILMNKGVNFVWFFVGAGPEEVYIQKTIDEYGLNEHIKLLGLRTNPYSYIRQCDIYVQTSLYEGFGITISEAKILKKPIVSTDFDVVYNQLTDEVNGLIVSKTGQDVANAILRICNDKNLAKRLVGNLLKEQNLTSLTEVGKVEELFDAN